MRLNDRLNEYDVLRYKMTFDIEKLPNVKILIKNWMQLRIDEETQNTITVHGMRHVIDCMLTEIFFHAQRHNALGTYEVKYMGKCRLGKPRMIGE